MFIAKQGVLDRIEQSFGILMKSPLALIVPIALFQIMMITILPQIGMSLMFGGNLINTSSTESFYYIGISIAIVYFIFFLLLMVPLTSSVIKTIADIIQQKEIDIQGNIVYGFRKMSDMFGIYWRLFEYVYLLPALCFIFAGGIMLYGLYSNTEVFATIGGGLMTLSVIYAVIQGCYRGVKCSFPIYASIYENDFTKEQFRHSISVTKGNWSRILGNFIVVGIICSLALSMISGLLNSLSFLSVDMSDIFSALNQESQDIQDMIEDMGDFSILSLIIESLSQILSSIMSVFLMIFTLIFYIRLKQETGSEREDINKTVETSEL